MCAREPTQGFLTQGLRVRPVATPRRGGFRVGAIGQIGIARGGGEGKKLTFCYFWYCPDLPGRFLSNSVRNRGDPDDEFLGSWWAPGLLLLEEKAAWSSSQFVRFPPMVSKPQSRIEPRWTCKRNACKTVRVHLETCTVNDNQEALSFIPVMHQPVFFSVFLRLHGYHGKKKG